ncbi:hypothetical protein BC941DRAFT_410982 [Chlamydoabsidia padenii]|nr:hypothetical protein BC941DRAFT_410982 [Chlamydoabsidia padenii]
MVSKVDLQRWQKACHAFDSQNYIKALDTLLKCCPSSKTYFNIGVIMLALHDYQHASNVFAKAIEHDPYLSIAYFQSGVSNIMLGNFGLAVNYFDLTYQSLRGNKSINYRQLGLDFTLYACEILYNRGMCQIYLDNESAGMGDLYQAQQLKMNQRHHIIDQATLDTERSTFGVYSIPPGVIYRPREYQLQLLTANDSSTSLHNYYSFTLLEFLFLDQHNRKTQTKPPLYIQQQQQQQQQQKKNNKHDGMYQHYRHIPKYVSKYLIAAITKDKINMAATALKPLPSVSLSSPLCLQLQQHKGITMQHTKRPSKSNTNKNPQDGYAHSERYNDEYSCPLDQSFGNGDGRIKLKIHFEDTHILVVNSDIAFEDLWIKVHDKLNVSNGRRLMLHIKNEGGILTHMIDDEGWSLAKRLMIHLNSGKRMTKSRYAGKIEIWCTALNK